MTPLGLAKSLTAVPGEPSAPIGAPQSVWLFSRVSSHTEKYVVPFHAVAASVSEFDAAETTYGAPAVSVFCVAVTLTPRTSEPVPVTVVYSRRTMTPPGPSEAAAYS